MSNLGNSKEVALAFQYWHGCLNFGRLAIALAFAPVLSVWPRRLDRG